jgi:phosphoglycerate dehydrogenase-like enzyme
VIDEKALYEALADGRLAGAAIDTWAEEPAHFSDKRFPSLYPFQNLENVILSPHAAAQEENGADRYIEDVTKKVLAYLRGEGISDAVDLLKGY